MFGKIEIRADLLIKTGMHIGGTEAFAAIGAIDSPVIKDKLSDLPMIPGSSIKGKMRSLLSKQYNDGKPVKSHGEDGEKIIRLFGKANGKGDEKGRESRLIFSDTIISNKDEILEAGADSPTEAKMENTINRLSAVANPRQIERVIRGAKFPISIIYNVYNIEEDELVEDFKSIVEGLKLLTYDYLGGHGSRGYGRIEFDNLDCKMVIGEIQEEVISKCKSLLKEVCDEL
ncbi:MAG: type III-A CRISPR-associated RAMP protein Csm3 [Anaerovoracaceae bacterium]